MHEIPERCRPYEEDLSAFVDGELDAGRRTEVGAHVESCAACARRAAAFRATDASLRRAGERLVGSEAARLERVRGAVISQLQGDPGEPRAPARRAPLRRRRWPPALAAAALAASAAGLVLLVRPEPASIATDPHETIAAAQAPTALAEQETRDAFAATGASAVAEPEAPAAASAAADSLDAASDEELALAAELRELRIESKGDLEIVERLDLLEKLDALDAAEPGRG